MSFGRVGRVRHGPIEIDMNEGFIRIPREDAKLMLGPRTADVVIYKEGDNAIAVDSKGRIIAGPSTDHASVIQSAIDYIKGLGGGKVFIAKAEYTLSHNLYISNALHMTIESDGAKLSFNNITNITPYEANALTIDSSDDITVKGLHIQGDGSTVYDGIYVHGSTYVTIKHNIIEDTGEDAIAVDTSSDVTVENNTLINVNHIGTSNYGIDIDATRYTVAYNIIHAGASSRSGANGISVKGVQGTITGNHIYDTEYGIYVYKGLVETRNINIIGNTIQNASVVGIYLVGDMSGVLVAHNTVYNAGIGIQTNTAGIAIIGNTVKLTNTRGIYIAGDRSLVVGNTVIDPNESGSTGADGAGIVLVTQDCIVAHNKIYDSRATVKMWNAINIANAVTSGYVISNYVGSSKATRIYRGTSTAIVRYNIGYVTENGGQATFSGDGTTTQFTIAHGLASTPSKVIVTPASNDAAGDFYVTADSTNIYVNYKTAPPSGSNNVVLYWWAEA